MDSPVTNCTFFLTRLFSDNNKCNIYSLTPNLCPPFILHSIYIACETNCREDRNIHRYIIFTDSSFWSVDTVFLCLLIYLSLNKSECLPIGGLYDISNVVLIESVCWFYGNVSVKISYDDHNRSVRMHQTRPCSHLYTAIWLSVSQCTWQCISPLLTWPGYR